MLAALLAYTFFNPLPLAGSETPDYGSLRGVVQNHQGAPVGGATVIATSDVDVLTVRSDGDGHFSFLSLLPGIYSVTATKKGFVAYCPSLGKLFDSTEIAAGTEYGAVIELEDSCP
jgi:hypothetical protein